MPLVRWTFDDFTVPLNPLSGGLPSRKKNITETGTTAPGQEATVILWEGAPSAGHVQFSGSILLEAHYRFFDDWAKGQTIKQVTDDLGNSWPLLMVDFEPTRKNRIHNPWAMTYTADTIITGPF